jgi:hypothetical protein
MNLLWMSSAQQEVRSQNRESLGEISFWTSHE